MKHLVKSFREVIVESRNLGVWVAVWRLMYCFQKGQHEPKNGSVLHKPVLIFDKIEGELAVESYIDAFLESFALDIE